MRSATVLVALLVYLSTAAAQEAEPVSPAESEIRAVGAAYVEAYNAGDAEALAAFWSPEAVYVDRLTGEQLIGRDALAEQFRAMFAEASGAKLAVDVESIQFVSPNVAVESGVSRYLIEGVAPEEVSYSAVYVRRDGKWLLDRVTDESLPEPEPSNYEKLQVLEWLVGSWIDQDETVSVATECQWTKNRNFLTQQFAVTGPAGVELSGMQIIGWDAAAEKIRSWTFDSSGGFAAAVWLHQDDAWYVQQQGVLQDGGEAAATQIYRPVDESSFTFESVNRTMDGRMLPNVEEVLVVRQAP